MELVGTVFLPDRPTEPAVGRAEGGFSPLAPDPVRLLQKGQIGINGWSYLLGRSAEEAQAACAADMAVRQYRPSDPTNFDGEETRTVAEIRRVGAPSPIRGRARASTARIPIPGGVVEHPGKGGSQRSKPTTKRFISGASRTKSRRPRPTAERHCGITTRPTQNFRPATTTLKREKSFPKSSAPHSRIDKQQNARTGDRPSAGFCWIVYASSTRKSPPGLSRRNATQA